MSSQPLINSTNKLDQQFFAKGLCVIAVLIAVGSFLIAPKPVAELESNSETQPEISIENQITARQRDINIAANSALVWDKTQNRILYSKNSDQQLPLASVTKLLTAITALKYIPKDQEIFITLSDLDTDGESGLLAGEKWSRDGLINFTLITSSNDGATALARVASQATNRTFSDLMTLTAREIGLEGSTWKNPTGLDTIDGAKASNYASAEEVLILLDYFITNYPDIAYAAGEEQADFNTNLKQHHVNTTNELNLTIPHTISAKTGFTYVAGGNLAIITDIGLARPVYIVVLGSTHEARFSDVERLYELSTDIIQS